MVSSSRACSKSSSCILRPIPSGPLRHIETGMDGDIGVLPFGTGTILWPPEVDRILGYEGPIAIEDDWL